MARHGKAQHTAQPNKWEKKQSDKQMKKKTPKLEERTKTTIYIYIV